MLFPVPALTAADEAVLADIENRRRHLTVAAKQTPGLMDELVSWLNADDGAHPLVRAAMAHLNLVSIHPWPGGNGPMARALQSLIIAREGVVQPQFLSFESWLGGLMNTWRYYEELQRRGPLHRPDQDVSGWIRLNLTAYHHRAQLVQRKIDKSVEVWDRLRTFAGRAGLDERVVFALHDVAMIGRVRRERYARSERISSKTAQRDLRDLAAAGLLAPVGGVRVRYHVEGPRFPEQILEAARRPMTLTKPYSDAVG